MFKVVYFCNYALVPANPPLLECSLEVCIQRECQAPPTISFEFLHQVQINVLLVLFSFLEVIKRLHDGKWASKGNRGRVHGLKLFHVQSIVSRA